MVTITSVPLLPVLTAKILVLITLPTISVLKAGDYQHALNKAVLLAISLLSPLYIAGTTSMARFAMLAPAVTGGPLLRTVAAISTPSTTTATVAYLPPLTSAPGSRYGVFDLASLVNSL